MSRAADDGEGGEERDDEQWRFGLDDLERDPEIEPGSPSLENAAFVLLGVLSTVLVVLRIAFPG